MLGLVIDKRGKHRTRDLAEVVGRADIVVAAVGKAAFVPGSWIKDRLCVLKNKKQKSLQSISKAKSIFHASAHLTDCSPKCPNFGSGL